MSSRSEKTFGSDFRRFFGRGLAILLPSVLTLWILYQLFLFVLNNVGAPINTGIRVVVIEAAPRIWSDDQLPAMFRVTDADVARERASLSGANVDRITDKQLQDRVRRKQFKDWWDRTPGMNLIGLAVAVVTIYFAGLVLGGYLGKRLYVRIEQLIAQVPGFKQLYPHVKKVVEMIFGESSSKAFTEVVLVEYPRKGIWTIGLLTSDGFNELREQAKGAVVSVFIPTSPTPMTGFVINVRREEAHPMKMSVEEALRYVISAGVLSPDDPIQGRAVAATADAKALEPESEA